MGKEKWQRRGAEVNHRDIEWWGSIERLRGLFLLLFSDDNPFNPPGPLDVSGRENFKHLQSSKWKQSLNISGSIRNE